MAEEKELMAGDTESTRKLGVGAQLASLEFVHLTASVATEMMMMGLASHLIPQGFARHGDSRKPVALYQGTDIAIYGGDAKPFNLSLRGV